MAIKTDFYGPLNLGQSLKLGFMVILYAMKSVVAFHDA